MKQNRTRPTSVATLFTEYVATNIIGQMGMSAYILVDTFFISIAGGATGMAALNLVLPFYDLIFAFGDMLAVGSATRFTICRARGEEDADRYFTNSIVWSVLCGLPFMLLGTCFAPQLLRLLGADAAVSAMGVPYTRIFMLFAPLFMINRCISAFTRNDGAPRTAMVAVFLRLHLHVSNEAWHRGSRTRDRHCPDRELHHLRYASLLKEMHDSHEELEAIRAQNRTECAARDRRVHR